MVKDHSDSEKGNQLPSETETYCFTKLLACPYTLMVEIPSTEAARWPRYGDRVRLSMNLSRCRMGVNMYASTKNTTERGKMTSRSHGNNTQIITSAKNTRKMFCRYNSRFDGKRTSTEKGLK